MKFLFLILFTLFNGHTFAQIDLNPDKTPKGLILYPEIYQVITLEIMQDFQPSALQNLDYNLTIIEGDNKLEIFIQHDYFSTFQKTKDMLLDNLKIALNSTAAIISNRSYGREYLPSHYWVYINSAKSLIKHHPTLF